MRSKVYPDVLALFTPSERQETHEPYEGQEDLTEDEVEFEHYYFYSSSVQVLRERLDVIGYTEARARAHFCAYELACRDFDDEDNYGQVLLVPDFAVWQRYIRYAVENGIDRWTIDTPDNRENRSPWSRPLVLWDEVEYPKLLQMLEAEEYFSEQRLGYPIEDCDLLLWLRAIFSCVDGSVSVALDYSALVSGGYYSGPDLFTEHKDTTPYQVSMKTILLTEGSTDRVVLSRALERRFPHLAHLYQFLDFHGKVAGGAPELVKLVRAFAGCEVPGRFIALFDADTAAGEALHDLNQANLPANIKILQLPPLDVARQYPTIGPQGDNVVMDVNAMACSLEMYLGRTVLQSSMTGDLVKVQWSGYSRKMRRYQGELVGKDQVRERFLDKLANSPESLDWSGLDLIFQRVFEAFNQDKSERPS